MKLFPRSGPVGTRVDFVGKCFDREAWRSFRQEGGYGVFMIRTIEGPYECELLAGDKLRVRVGHFGDAEGSFRVPARGSCFQREQTRALTPGVYEIAAFCHACSVKGGRFRVTSRRTAPHCEPGAVAMVLGMDGATGMVTIFAAFDLRPQAHPCTLLTMINLSLEDADDPPIDVKGNPARRRLEANLWAGNEGYFSVAWSWHNWCGDTDRLRLEIATNGGWAGTIPVRTTPRCDAPESDSSMFRVPA